MTGAVDLTGWTAPLLLAAPGQRGQIRARGLAVLVALSGAQRLACGRADAVPGSLLGPLLRSVAIRDPGCAAYAADGLLGLGPGLTPEGDDLIAGAAAAVYAFAGAAGWSESVRFAWLATVAPPDLDARTTALSAALLRRACRGEAFAPMRDLLDVSVAGENRWRPALATMTAIGASTGRAYVRAAGAAAYLITTGQGD
jgi:hypothetical protein